MLKLWRTIRRLLRTVEWPCERCGWSNLTSELLWSEMKYRLICERCRYMQNYPDYIKKLDPHPPTWVEMYDVSASRRV